MKRIALASGLAIVLMIGTTALTVEPPKKPPVEKPAVRKDLLRRYGIEADLKRYPQDDPRLAIRSVIRAVTAGDFEYMLAHLISPSQVDEKLKGDRQAFRKLLAKATPEKSEQMTEALRQQLEKGTWTINRDMAWSELKDVPLLSLEKLGNRWFMHNVPIPRAKPRTAPAAAPDSTHK